MIVKIYKPSKNVMQSGRGKANYWLLEYELQSKRQPDALMGWTSGADTLNQVQIKFSTSAEAMDFAKAKGWTYDVLPAHERIVKPRNYADNFKAEPVEKQENA